MVENHKQDSGIVLKLAKGGEHRDGVGGGKNIARNARVEHSLSDESAEGGLVPGAAHRDYRNLFARLGDCARDNPALFEPYLVRIRACEPFEKLVRQVFGRI